MSRQGQNVGRKDKTQHHPLSRQGQYMGHDKTYCVPDGTLNRGYLFSTDMMFLTEHCKRHNFFEQK